MDYIHENDDDFDCIVSHDLLLSGVSAPETKINDYKLIFNHQNRLRSMPVHLKYSQDGSQ